MLFLFSTRLKRFYFLLLNVENSFTFLASSTSIIDCCANASFGHKNTHHLIAISLAPLPPGCYLLYHRLFSVPSLHVHDLPWIVWPPLRSLISWLLTGRNGNVWIRLTLRSERLLPKPKTPENHEATESGVIGTAPDLHVRFGCPVQVRSPERIYGLVDKQRRSARRVEVMLNY